MEIYSSNYFIFVISSVFIFLLLPGKFQNLFLLLASYFFYISWDWRYAAALFILTVFNYGYAQFLEKNLAKKNPWILRAGVVVNITFWLVFLLGARAVELLNELLSQAGFSTIVFSLLLPLGFSYRVFESISYLVDIRLKLAKASKNFLDYATYMAYFPKLVSGPLERGRIFLPQLVKQAVVDDDQIKRSITLIILGLTRSIVLAGMLTVLIPRSIFIKPLDYSSTQIVFGLIIYGFYLYNQFAGYTDLMRGISGFFGIQLTRNFSTPFFSQNFSDFWRRWHISLSQWLRDYVFMPLSRSFLRRNPSRKNIPNLIIPPMVTMLVSGFWHGATLNLLLWGAINGGFILVENLLNLFVSTNPSGKVVLWRKLLGSLVVLSLALLAAIPFRLDLPTSKVYLYGIVKWNQWDLPDVRPWIVMGVSLLLDWFQFHSGDEFVFIKWSGWLKVSLVAITVAAMMVVYNLQLAPATFVYP